ncbi:cyclic nucleotide-binding/CBS domain-containing protein [Noviherbaspirillum sp. UKPF54]|uniref:CBS domain-containing protein n=1 Tax=Noviherbaspirillum sp. UKPF54 TaxID=2601898 RepID=UPI0011B19C0A|nr:CBS domain-containing protein [Noviherbaspirillum sp. UKPF54]QDZ27098.1 CBS domain-containing protein [Noviherbaspirillum sp. UKPF54]
MSDPISSIMHATVTPVSMDDTVEIVELLMKTRHISSAPVYDGDGAILGIVTATDLVKFHAMGKDPKIVKAWEICTYRPVEVTPDTPVIEVAALMLEHKVHHVVVMENEAMCGIVSSLDFVRLFAEQNRR